MVLVVAHSEVGVEVLSGGARHAVGGSIAALDVPLAGLGVGQKNGHLRITGWAY